MKKLKIGNVELENNIVLGPMAGVTSPAYRKICRDFNVGMVYAEMVSVEGITHNNEKSLRMLSVDKKERPLAMQIFGHNIESYLKAVKYVDENCDCDVIDINMGCPAPKVSIKSQAGASLLKDPIKIGEIIKSAVSMTKKPVTVKLRIGWDENNINILEVAKICEESGAKAITVHARTRQQFFKGKADWSWIKKVKEIVKIPVIGNGDVVDEYTAKAMIEETGCDGIMISREAQGNPWIFKRVVHFFKTKKFLEKPSPFEVKEVILKHFDYLLEEKDEEFAAREMRKHLVWYFRHIPKDKKNENINQHAVRVESKNDIIKLLEEEIYL